MLDNILGRVMFTMAIVSSVVTELCTMQYLRNNSDDITIWYNVVMTFVTTIFMLVGFCYLFERRLSANIGTHDRGMGLVVFVTSMTLSCLEIVLLVMIYKRPTVSVAFRMYLIFLALQKIVQLVVYLALRRCVPHANFKNGAIYYLKFLSYLNFTYWVASVPFTNIRLYEEVANSLSLQLVNEVFNAMRIDYRLLCAFLFFEHAISIEDSDLAEPHREEDQQFDLPRHRCKATILGLVIGCFLLALEIVNGLQFFNKNYPLPDFVNLFPILVDFIVVCLVIALAVNVKSKLVHNQSGNLVVVMVTSMGVASILYLFTFSMLSFVSFKDSPKSYVTWSAFVFLSRGLSLFVLLLVYSGVSINKMKMKENLLLKNYFIVAALFSGLIARFVGCVLDESNGKMHEIAHHHIESKELRPLSDLFALGPLFQLAATLHICLHFLLMLVRSHEKRFLVDEDKDYRSSHISQDGDSSTQGPSSVILKETVEEIRENDSGITSSAVHLIDENYANDKAPLSKVPRAKQNGV